MPGLSVSALARQAGVSQQGVSAAVKRGVLRRGPDGLIDPSIEPNKSWLGLHAQGLDWRGRDMWSYARPTGKKSESMPAKIADTAELDSPDEVVVGGFTDAELDALLVGGNERVLEAIAAIRNELREGLHRINEQLGELNFRLAIRRDPFLGNTVAGVRLREKDEAELAAPAAGARSPAKIG